MNESTNEWIDGWMDGWMNVKLKVYLLRLLLIGVKECSVFFKTLSFISRWISLLNCHGPVTLIFTLIKHTKYSIFPYTMDSSKHLAWRVFKFNWGINSMFFHLIRKNRRISSSEFEDAVISTYLCQESILTLQLEAKNVHPSKLYLPPQRKRHWCKTFSNKQASP